MSYDVIVTINGWPWQRPCLAEAVPGDEVTTS